MNKKTITWILALLILLPATFARITDILEQEQTKTYGTYQLKVLYIGQNRVKFQLNNMTSDLLGNYDLYKFEDGSYIYVREILEEEALEGPDRVSFRLYLAKVAVTTKPEIIQNITEQELPSIVPEEEPAIPPTQPPPTAIEEAIPIEEVPPALPEEIEEEKPPEKQTFLQWLINLIKNLFRIK